MAAYLVWADDFQLVSDPSQRHDSVSTALSLEFIRMIDTDKMLAATVCPRAR
jgi:hypothetical protein